jgi:hypothetical protein
MTPLPYLGPTDENLAAIPQELKDLDQWVDWRGVDRMDQHTGEVKLNKIPINPVDLTHADSTDPRTWSSFSVATSAIATALEEWEQENPTAYRGGGVGFVVTDQDPYVGIDLDNCVDPVTGEIAPWAQAIVDAFASYTEITPTGTGLRIWVKGTLPPRGRKKGLVEMYSDLRFFTVTGWHVAGTPGTIALRQAQLNALWCSRFGAQVGDQVWLQDDQGTLTNHDGKPWEILAIQPAPDGEPYAFFQETTSGWPLVRCEVMVPIHTQGTTPVIEDTVVVQRALGAANSHKVRQLAAGQWQSYGYGSQSEADMALCCELAFWTRDPAQIDRLFRLSGLMRPKWDDKRGTSTYGARTIQAALAWQHTYYGSATFKLPTPLQPPASGSSVPTPGVSTASSMVSPGGQVSSGGIWMPGAGNGTTAQVWGTPRQPLIFTDVANIWPKQFELPRWLIDELIPEGLTYLVGSQKSGKTYLSYSLALTLATSLLTHTLWLDYYPVLLDGPVFYLSLEDNENMFWHRIHQLMPYLQTFPKDRFFFRYDPLVPSLGEGLTDFLYADIIKPYHPALLVIDPISYVSGLPQNSKRNANDFSEFRRIMLPLRTQAADAHVALLGVEHRRKKSADDVDLFETQQGSNAKGAIADSTLVIVREAEDITMHARVRNAREQTITLAFSFDNQQRAMITYKGSHDGFLDPGNFSTMRVKVLDALMTLKQPMSMPELLAAAGIPDSKQARQAMYQLLYRAVRAGEIQKTTRGMYVWSGGI